MSLAEIYQHHEKDKKYHYDDRQGCSGMGTCRNGVPTPLFGVGTCSHAPFFFLLLILVTAIGGRPKPECASCQGS